MSALSIAPAETPVLSRFPAARYNGKGLPFCTGTEATISGSRGDSGPPPVASKTDPAFRSRAVLATRSTRGSTVTPPVERFNKPAQSIEIGVSTPNK